MTVWITFLVVCLCLAAEGHCYVYRVKFRFISKLFFLLSENCKIVSYPVAILCITISVNLLLFLRKLKSPPWFVFFWSSFKCVEHEIIEENFLKHNYPLKHLGTPPSEIIFYFCNLLNSYNCTFSFISVNDGFHFHFSLISYFVYYISCSF